MSQKPRNTSPLREALLARGNVYPTTETHFAPKTLSKEESQAVAIAARRHELGSKSVVSKK